MEHVARRLKRHNKPSAAATERRKDLRESAIRCIADKGFAAVSTSTICDDGGFSRGLIGHYFKGKDELMLEAINSVIAQWTAAIRRDMKAAGADPTDRLHALVRASFSRAVLTQPQAAVWIALVGGAKWSAPFGQKYQQLWREYRAGAETMFAGAVHGERRVEAETAALLLSRAVEGFWIASVANSEGVATTESEKACHWLVDLLLGQPLGDYTSNLG